MSTPGIADPYWYEWYVGLQQVINMINPDKYISYVIFQSKNHDTIDDVVVGYEDKLEICYQVKHEIGNTGKTSLTFASLIKVKMEKGKKVKKSLLNELAIGWKKAKKSEEKTIVPVLFTNKQLGINASKRKYNDNEYNAVGLIKFIEEIQPLLLPDVSLSDVRQSITSLDLKIQWDEFSNAIEENEVDILDFLRTLEIRANEPSLDELEEKMIEQVKYIFQCNLAMAKSLFSKLCFGLRIWTTTRRGDLDKVEIEDVYDVLALNEDSSSDNHKLPFPQPFFESREKFANEIEELINGGDEKVIFLSGDPGSGKTSLISYLALKKNSFKARYHTFKPISPEQSLYNLDSGLCEPKALWSELLIQLRAYFKGELHKYQIPVNNSLCNTEQLRNEVLKLAKKLQEKTGTKTVICIDGIDHAARAKDKVTFLSDLYKPSEIPNGVVFVIVGQRSHAYSNYPLWIKNKTKDVAYIEMPVLAKNDIVDLIENNNLNFDIDSNVLAKFIFQKTNGNNLSVAFSIEEAKKCKNMKELEETLDLKCVSDNITEYYSHIWNHVTSYLNARNVGIPFPDIALSSIITLLNGRVDTAVLSKAITPKLLNEDWYEIFNLLYPLIQKSNIDGEFTLFHNDFRVFLMGIIDKNSMKYKRIASELASYYQDNNYSLESTINLFQLLLSAEEVEKTAEVFDSEYVIKAFAYGISKNTLYEYANIAHEAAISAKSWDKYHKVYLALNTICQHHRYYENSEKKYVILDNSYLRTISKYELVNTKITNENVKQYIAMIDFCLGLLSLGDPISISRAKSVYNLWFQDITPIQFLNKLDEDESNMHEPYVIDEVMEKWANLLGEIGYKYIGEKGSKGKTVDRHLASFHNAYFEYLFRNDRIEESTVFISKYGITPKCLSDNLQEILLSDQTINYNSILKAFIKRSDIDFINLLVHVCLIKNNDPVLLVNIGEFEKPKYIHNDPTREVILLAFIIGYQEYNIELSESLSHAKDLLSNVEKTDTSTYRYFEKLVCHSFLLGRFNNKNYRQDELEVKILSNSFEGVFLYNERNVRRFEFNDGFKIVLFLSLDNSSIVKAVGANLVCDLVTDHLFNRNLFGMHYKTIILDYLLKNGNDNIVEKYIRKLFGDSLFQEENFSEQFNHFKKYGLIVSEKLTRDVEAKLQWDVVSFVGHKDYSLYPILETFKKIVLLDSSYWETKGIDLYDLSYIADSKGDNRASSSIEQELSKAAAYSGFSNVWRLNKNYESFRFSLEMTYHQIIDLMSVVDTAKDLKALWILSCGILSWYNSSDRVGLKSIFDKCIEKANELRVLDFKEQLINISKPHVDISLMRQSEVEKSNLCNIEINSEELLKEKLSELSNEELFDFLRYEVSYSQKWSSLQIIMNIFVEKKILDKTMAQKFLSIVKIMLPNYSWEQSGGANIIEKIIKILGDDGLWNLAEYNFCKMDNEDHYDSIGSNMDFILQLSKKDQPLEIILDQFDHELDCHLQWITGCRKIVSQFEGEVIATTNLPDPTNVQEFTFNMLLEQINTHNIHRIEISLQGMHLLVKEEPSIFGFIADSWNYYSALQKEYLIKISERWAREKTKGFDLLFLILEEESHKTNRLDIKILLHAIICNYNENIETALMFNAEEIEYKLSVDNTTSILDESLICIQANYFLNIMEQCTSEPTNDIKSYILKGKKTIEKNYVQANRIRAGDSLLFPKSHSELDMQILYGEDKYGRWENVPVSIKAQALLTLDDPWLFSNIPIINNSKEWNIEEELKECIKSGCVEDCIPNLSKLINIEIVTDMELIGGVIWFPVGNEDGIIYSTTTKISQAEQYLDDKTISKALNSRVIFPSSKRNPFEIDIEYLDLQGICLTNILVGASEFMYGNSMMYPSEFLIEELDIRQRKENPFIWEDSERNPVLFFEQIAWPNRKTIQENYFRQPMISRWLCRKEILERLIVEGGYLSYNIDQIDKMPNMK
ncbi:ATP-binding protein [Listeria monocytogenes]|nr:ATP-binding protein [Listeria monocytogenes]EAD8886668.1 ATP-binding protein [Listeria monocytogenes]